MHEWEESNLLGWEKGNRVRLDGGRGVRRATVLEYIHEADITGHRILIVMTDHLTITALVNSGNGWVGPQCEKIHVSWIFEKEE